MQVGVDLKCMQTKFGGHGFSSFGDLAHFWLPSYLTKFHFRIMEGRLVIVTDYTCTYMYCTIVPSYRISGIFRGEKFCDFRKNYTQKTKNLYGSHLIFDRYAKF